MNLKELRLWGARELAKSEVASPQLDADVLLAFLLGCSRLELITRSDSTLSSELERRYKTLISRRAFLEPIAYLVGEKEFYGRKFAVNSSVLIPRPETEFLLEAAKTTIQFVSPERPIVAIDIGTGSGAIIVSLVKEVYPPQTDFFPFALDISSEALKIAASNAALLSAHGITFLESNLLDSFSPPPVSPNAYLLVLANLPYIAESEQLPADVANYEPHNALFAGPTGFELIEKLIEQVSSRTDFTTGCLILECGWQQAESICGTLSKFSCFRPPELIKDLQGISRIIKAEFSKSRPS